jgi:RecJ-like exonuclease
MACECVRCADCHGQGTIRVPGPGFDDLETCDECGGSGIVETCDECHDSIDAENS